MSFVRIRNRLEALERKLGLPLAVIRAPRVAYDVFNDWSVVMADQKPLPTAFQVVQRVRDAGIRNAAFMVLEQYIQRCLDEDRCPEPEGILNSLIPRACKSGLIRATLLTGPPPRTARRYQLAEPSESEISIAEAEFPLELAKAMAEILRQARGALTRGKQPRPRGRYSRTRTLRSSPAF